MNTPGGMGAGRLASERLATAWRAISHGLQGAQAAGQDGPLLEALAKLAGALAARLYCPEDHLEGMGSIGPAGEVSYLLGADWCWAPDATESRGLKLSLAPGTEGLVLLQGHELPFTHPAAWALLPLPHAGRIAAVIVLACPALPMAPDADTREALVLAARQAGCAIAARRAQGLLDDGARFGAFHRSLAFATHDIKGISSQLSLLASNTERLGGNPDFRADMLITLRAASARLDALLARLARGEGAGADAGGANELAAVGDIARAIAAALAARHQVSVIERDPCVVLGKADAVEQVLTHLVHNAVEASPAASPVFVGINADGPMARVEVIDSGHGMSPQFVAERLFRPFDTAKPGGFGIGAYEAREMVRAMGGRLDVESREGVGTRFVIRLPRAMGAERVAL